MSNSLYPRAAAVFVACALIACGGSNNNDRYFLQARLGTYEDGSGRTGVAILATLRDAAGVGPAQPWSLSLRSPEGALAATLEYPAGPVLARWLPAVSPAEGDWEIVAEGGGASARADVRLEAGGLAVPAPSLVTDATGLFWEPVSSAAAYACRAYASGELQLDETSTAPACDLGSLPSGAYSTSVLALSASPVAVAEASGPLPPLPARFDVSEARIAFVRPGVGGTVQQLRASGGAYDDGIGSRSLAFWIAIGASDGAATADTWQLEITGPNLSPNDPLTLTYWSQFPRIAAWAPELPASPGTYTVVARAGEQAVSTQFTVGAPRWLDLPLSIAASDGALGSARVDWEPVAGAMAYLVRAYDAETGEFTASHWAPAAGTDFPQGTFAAGRTYDVLVAATDADMVGGAVPAQIAVSENVFDLGTFVAR